MFERAGLRMMRNTVVYSDSSVPRRVLSAWIQNTQEELIAKASVSKDRLFVFSCALQPYEVAFESMPSLKRIPITERANFTVDEDGSYIYWAGPDIHVDLDAIRAAIDPEARARAEAAKALHDSRYGAAIAKLRSRMGLKQSQIEGLSKGRCAGSSRARERRTRRCVAWPRPIEWIWKRICENLRPTPPIRRLRERSPDSDSSMLGDAIWSLPRKSTATSVCRDCGLETHLEPFGPSSCEALSP